MRLLEINDTENSNLAYRRVLLKISGEALMGEQNYGIDVNVARSVAEELKAVHEVGCRCRSSSVAATSFAAFPRAPATWTARQQTTSECSPR